MKIPIQIIFSIIFAILITACSSSSGSETRPGEANIEDISIASRFSNEHRCSRDFDLSWVDYDAAAETPLLEPDLDEGVLGVAGAQALIQNIFSPEDTFCGGDLSADIQARLDVIDQLVADGELGEARGLLDELLRQLQVQLGLQQTIHVMASPARLSKEDTRRIVREYLEVAASAQEYGFDDLANESIEAAKDTFSEWANNVIDGLTDISEALTIAAVAQLLGLDGLGDDALEKVRELADKKLKEALNSFDPCDATREQTNNLLSHAALAMAVGGNRANVNSAINQFESARSSLSAKAKGEKSPDCTGDAFNFVETFSDGLVTISGEAFTCDGTNWRIDIEISCAPVGVDLTSTGSLEFTVNDGTSGALVIPTVGTATFGGNVASFQDPLGFKLTVRDDNSVFVEIGSTGAGTVNTPGGVIIFVSFPGGGFSDVLESANCTE